MTTSNTTPGVVYTFYSYKGGVGRSMTLANVAALMAVEGHRVLVIDWDLEAPGLEVFFEKSRAKLSSNRKETPGIVDLLEAVQRGTRRDWRECVIEIQLRGGKLDLIAAGQDTPDYKTRVQRLDWEKLFDEEHRLGNYLNEIREEWTAPGAYNFVLIDSRTGITDIGDICTVLLPDALVLLFISNWQNVKGIKDIMERAGKAHRELPVNRTRLIGVPIPSRDETYAEYDSAQEWKDIFAKEFEHIYRRWLPREVESRSVLDKLFIPYYAKWSFGERLPVIEQPKDIYNPTSISAAYARLKNLLVRGLDWQAIESYEVSSARSQAERHETVARSAKKTRNLTMAAASAAVIVLAAALFVMSGTGSNTAVEAWRIINATQGQRDSRERIAAIENLVSLNEDLSKTNFSNVNLIGLRATSAKLEKVIFVDSSLLGANLSRAQLGGANFENSELNKADFSGADLHNANFQSAVVSDAIFHGAILAGADFSGAKGLRPGQFDGACITEDTILNIKLVLPRCPSMK